MKILISLILLLSVPCFAGTSYKMYYKTYTTKTHKCSVDIFVPESGPVKVETICFKLK